MPGLGRVDVPTGVGPQTAHDAHIGQFSGCLTRNEHKGVLDAPATTTQTAHLIAEDEPVKAATSGSVDGEAIGGPDTQASNPGGALVAEARRAPEEGHRPKLALQAALLLCALVLLVALGGERTAISSDEGAGIHQAVLLKQGGWLLAPTLPDLDEEQVRQPFYNGDVGPNGRAPYAKHPVYPLLLERVSGSWPLGLFVPGVLGTWAAAVAAALLARALRARAAIPTLWLIGLGSPLTVDAHLVLAHAPAAGTAAIAALAVSVVLFPGSFGPFASRRWVPVASTVMAVIAAVATVALRSEGILLVASLALGAVVAGSPRRRSVGLAGALVVSAGATRLIEQSFVRSMLGASAATVPSPPSSSTGFFAARVEAFHASWLDVGYFGRPGEIFLAIGAAALALAVLGTRWRVRPLVSGFLAAAAVGATLVWLLLGETGLVPGLLPASPWLVAGLASFGLSSLRIGLARFLATASAAAAGVILATQYSFGGGVEWGGRFYAIVLPVAGPLAVAALWPATRRSWRSEWVVLAVVAITAMVSLGGLIAVRSSHAKTAALAQEVASAAALAPPARPADPDQRPVVVSPQRLWPQLLWPEFDTYRWVTVDRDRLPCALFDLRTAGFHRVVLLGPEAQELVALAGPQGWRELGRPTGRFTRVVEVGPGALGGPPICPPGLGSV